MSDREAVIRDFFSNLGADPDIALKHLTPDYKWWIAGVGDIDGHYDDMAAAIAPHLVAPIKTTVIDIIISGDKAAVELEANAELKNGTRYANEYFMKIGFVDNKIATIREYHNTAHAKEIFDPVVGSDH